MGIYTIKFFSSPLILGFNIGFLEISWVDVLDVLLVSYLLYLLYRVVKGSFAIRIAAGFLAIYLFYMIVRAFKMELLTAILGQFIGVGVLAAIILFQQEIRKFLQIVGNSTSLRNANWFKNLFKKSEEKSEVNIREILEAVRGLSGSNMGGLIAFARQSDISSIAEKGDLIDGVLSRRLLLSIFYKNSPLHDGAVVVSNNRIIAARCILPVSDDSSLPANFGLRHRSALGLSEVSDALVLIISEETGQVSIAIDGKIQHNLSPVELKHRLNFYLNNIGSLAPKKEEVKISEPKLA